MLLSFRNSVVESNGSKEIVGNLKNQFFENRFNICYAKCLGIGNVCIGSTSITA